MTALQRWMKRAGHTHVAGWRERGGYHSAGRPAAAGYDTVSGATACSVAVSPAASVTLTSTG